MSKILFLNPLDRAEAGPKDIAFELVTLAGMSTSGGDDPFLLDLNAVRQDNTPEGIKGQVGSDEYDMIWTHASFTAYADVIKALRILRKLQPTAVTVVSGKIATYLPEDTLKMNPEVDVCVVGDPFEAFTEIQDHVQGQRWSGIDGIAYTEGKEVVKTKARVLKKSLDELSFPDPPGLNVYFQNSKLLYCEESLRCFRRLSFKWARDVVNPETGKVEVRFPSAKRAVENIVAMRYKQAIDFCSITDPSFKWDTMWLKEFVDAYMDEGLFELVPWSCHGDAWSISQSADMVRWLSESGCKACVLDFDVFDPVKLEFRQKAIDLLKKHLINPVVRQHIGYPGENINHLLEAAYFLMKNRLDVFDVAIMNPYPDTAYFTEPYKASILRQYSGSLEAFLTDESHDITANISNAFPTDSLIALKMLVRSKDLRKILLLAHLRGWNHDSKWNTFCPHCKDKPVPPEITKLSPLAQALFKSKVLNPSHSSTPAERIVLGENKS